jgi:5'-3' exonuclease
MRGHGHRCVLVTRDKDLAQLIREGDHFWDYAGDRRLQYHEIAGHFGVLPERVPDYLALTGDSVDNVPGVPGVGPKTAAVLLKHFASLEELYDNLDELAKLPMRGAGGVADKLRAHRDTAYLARQLTRIACDMELDVEGPDALRRRAPDLAGIESLYDRMNFGPALRRQAQRLAREF